MHYLFMLIYRILKIKKSCGKYPSISRLILYFLCLLTILVGLFVDEPPYITTLVFLLPYSLAIYWTSIDPSYDRFKSKKYALLMRYLTGIEGYCLAVNIKAIYLNQEDQSYDNNLQLLEGYYMSKHAYENTYSSNYLPKLTDLDGKKPSITSRLEYAKKEAEKRRVSVMDA